MISLLAALALVEQTPVLERFGADAGIVIRRVDDSLREEFYVLDGEERILVAQGDRFGQFTLEFTEVDDLGRSVRLTSGNSSRFIEIPQEGAEFRITESIHPSNPVRLIGRMTAYNLLPEGRTHWLSSAQRDGGWISDQQFRSPYALAIGERYAVAMYGDLDSLSLVQPMPGAFGASEAEGTAAYGVAFSRRTADGTYFAREEAREVALPVSYSLYLKVWEDVENPIVELAHHLWDKFGEARYSNALPQSAPYSLVPRHVLDMSRVQQIPRGDDAFRGAVSLLDTEINGEQVYLSLAPDNATTFTAFENQVRVAYGMIVQGERTGRLSWRDNGLGMARAALAAPWLMGLPANVYRYDERLWYSLGSPRQLRADAAATGLSLLDIHETESGSELTGIENWASRLNETLSEPTAGPATGFSELFQLAYWRKFNNRLPENAAAMLASCIAGFSIGDEYAPLVALAALELATALGDRDGVNWARNAFGVISLEQSIWSMPHRATNETFGSIPYPQTALATVHQPVYATTLLRAGELLGDERLFKRGSAALRLPFARLQFSTTRANGYFIPANIVDHRMATTYGVVGADALSVDQGFIRGTGQALWATTWSSERYGDAYRSIHGWIVGLDGVVAQGDAIFSTLSANPVPFDRDREVRVKRYDGQLTDPFDPERKFGIANVFVSLSESGPVLVAIPSMPLTMDEAEALDVQFAIGDQRIAASLGPQGFQAPADAEALRASSVRVVMNRASSAVSGDVPLEEVDYVSREFHVFVEPPVDSGDPHPRGWSRRGDLADARPMKNNGFISSGHGFEGNWEGEFETSDALAGYIGWILSPSFLAHGDYIVMEVVGSHDPNVTIEIVTDPYLDVVRSYPLSDVFSDSDGQAVELSIDISELRGQLIRIRINDSSRQGWGAIRNVRTNVRLDMPPLIDP